MPTAVSEELPCGALRRLGDGLETDGRIWIQAEPVALRPDQDRLLMFDMVDFDLDAADAARCIAAFNGHFERDGLRLEQGTPCRWYLALDRMPRILTSPLGEAFGRNMDMFLPRGEEALEWHRLLNEVQMLFHGLSVNQERQAAGRMPVGGLWLSGAGRLPTVKPLFDLVVGDEPLALGLARAAGIATAPLSRGDGIGDFEGGEVLWVNDRMLRPVWQADPVRWLEEAAEFCRRFEACVALLRRGRFQRIRLYPGDGQVYSLSKGSFRRFWRRQRALAERMLSG